MPYTEGMSMHLTQSSLKTLNELVEHEESWWVDVCARIAEGEGYWDIARGLAIKPALFRGWIGGDAGREKAFQEALGYRGEYRKERASARLAAFVDAEVDEDEITPGHVLKAIEGTLGGGVGVKVDTQITIIHESA